MPPRGALFVLLAAGGFFPFLTGCAFERTVVNAGRELDLTRIEPGKSTWRDVLRELGPPDVPLKNLRAFTYTHSDARVTGFRIGYIVYVPFRWSDRQKVDDVLVEFDNKGVVATVARTRRDTIRRPLQGEGSRNASSTEVIQ